MFQGHSFQSRYVTVIPLYDEAYETGTFTFWVKSGKQNCQSLHIRAEHPRNLGPFAKVWEVL